MRPNLSTSAQELETSGNPSAEPHVFVMGEDALLLDGRPSQICCGEIHAARVPRPYWRHRLQMARAMGLNTISTYQFWNLVERREGEFDWSGQADIAEFCRIAQSEGLWVLVRPGPYCCAEWDMGGLPWWLLKHDDIALRSRDPRFMAAARRYLQEVGRILRPLQVTQGGPILMIQVENEYGFYDTDAEYIGMLQQIFVDVGFEVPLFLCNPIHRLKQGHCDDLLPVVNFAPGDIAGFKELRVILPNGPMMCGEFYSGWFDTWGAPHHTSNSERRLADLEAMLEAGHSFSLYMAHGGTTFGLWSGADTPFKPDTSSYDFDAPISEAGWSRSPFDEIRELIERNRLPGGPLPVAPQPYPVIAIPTMQVKDCAPLLEQLASGFCTDEPMTMERFDQGFGCINYRITLAEGSEATLGCSAIDDFGVVFLDGKLVDTMDRRHGKFLVRLPERARSALLDILVEAMGRVNFGRGLHDRKGIHAPVTLNGAELLGWETFCLPLDAAMLKSLRFSRVRAEGPAFWRATFMLDQCGDTFFDLRDWRKGVVWVNGHCLGRFWDIGPTQTLYVPGCWLRLGENEVVIFDLFGPEQPRIAGLEQPILDQLRPERDFCQGRAPRAIRLAPDDLVLTTGFAPGEQPQEVRLEVPVTGRYFCLESLSAFDGQQFAAVAQLDLLDEGGEPLSHETWTIAYVDSEEKNQEDGSAENAINGQTVDFWHTVWSQAKPDHPHQLVIDLGRSITLSGFRYVPRQSPGGGRIKDFRIYVGDGLVVPE
jgi:beta-galactosidase